MTRAWLAASVIVACAVATAGFLLSGCGGSSALDPVAQAAQVSALAPGFKVSLSEEIMQPDSSVTVTGSGTGAIDQRDRRGSLNLQINAAGHSINEETLFADLVLYLHGPSGQAPAIAHGKPWIRLDMGRVGAALGVNFSSLSGSASSDPSQLLSYLQASSGQVTRIGAEQLQGVPTTHYRATIDYDLYASRVTPSRRAAASQSVAALERLTGAHTQPVDVWVDEQHRVRREAYVVQECLPGIPGKTQIRLQTEYFDFGDQIVPVAPPSGQTYDVTSYIAEKLKNVKLGCQ